MSIDINGVAHIYITVQDFQRCRPFYGALLPYFGMVCLVDTDELYYCIGGRTGIGIRAAAAEHAGAPYDQYRAGLHHLCLRARSNEDLLGPLVEEERAVSIILAMLQDRVPASFTPVAPARQAIDLLSAPGLAIHERTRLEIGFGDARHDILTNFESCASPFHETLPIYSVRP